MLIKYSELKDEDLLFEISLGNKKAFAEITERHAKRFFRVAYRIVLNKEDAEEIVQEVFIKLWQKPEIWDPTKGAKFTTWFYKVITNQALNLVKSRKYSTDVEMLEIASSDESTEELMFRESRQKWLEKEVLKLPKSQQLALNLCFFQELSNQEAADVMNTSLKSVQSLIMRAKTTLRNQVKKKM